MTSDSEIYRTTGLLLSDLSSQLEAMTRLALADEVSRVKNFSAGAFFDSDLSALSLGSNQREFEEAPRTARNSFTVSSAQDAAALLGIAGLSEYDAVAGSAIGPASTLSTGLTALGASSKLSFLDEAARHVENSYSASLGSDASAVFVNSLVSQVEDATRIVSSSSLGFPDSQLSAIGASAHLTAFDEARRRAEDALTVWPKTVESSFLKSYVSALSSSSNLSPLVDAVRLAKNSFTAWFDTDAAASLKRVTEPATALQSQMDWYEQSFGALKGIDSLRLQNESVLSRSKLVTEYLDRVAGIGSLSDTFEQSLKAAILPASLLASIAEFSKTASGSEQFFSSSLADLTGNLGRFDAFRSLHDTPAWRVFEAAAEAATAQVEIDGDDEGNYQQAVIAELGRTAVEVSAQSTELQVLKSILSALDALLKSNQQSACEKWLIAVLIPLLFMLIAAALNPVFDFYVKRNLEPLTARETAKAVKEDALDQVGDLRWLSERRFVSSGKLSVMMSPKAKSPVIADLRKGAVVHVLERDGSFTLVSWRSEDGNVEVKGWVFSRYLERFS